MSYRRKNPTLLARTAESLFWMGRYLERAEQSARILDVHVADLIGTTIEQRTRWAYEIQALVGAEPRASNFEELSLELSLAKSEPASIYRCIEQAWENAKSARDTISLELWESINVTHSRLQRTFSADLGYSPHAFFAWVKDRGATCRGLEETTMNRDQAWLFLHLGRTLEQLDLTARLLRVKLSEPDEEDWVVVLRCAGGHEAFLRALQRPVEKDLAIQFLLGEAIFPKSVLHLAEVAERTLLEMESVGSVPWRSSRIPPTLARLIARLKYPLGDELASKAVEHLGEVASTQKELAEHLNSSYFSPARDSAANLPQRSEVWL